MKYLRGTSRRIRRRANAFHGVATAIGIVGCLGPGQLDLRGGENRELRDSLFSRPQVLRVDLEIAPSGVETLREYRWQWNPEETQVRPKVKVTVRESGEVYRDVSAHLKGAAGSFRSIDERPSFTLNFDRHIEGQRFHGMDKVSLNNSIQDPTLCNEWLARRLFLAAGIPVPRVTHARVSLNGRELGLYLLVEGYDRGFLRGYFEDVSGNLFDGGFVQDIDGKLGVNSGEDRQDRSALNRLQEAIQVEDLEERRERIAALLDVDRFLVHLALDVLMFNWDGYHMNRNNYRVFHDRARDQVVFMPHGLDQLFENADGPIFPFYQGQVTQAVMAVPAWQEQHVQSIRDLLDDLFDADRLTEQVRELATIIRQDLVLHDTDAAERYRQDVAGLEQRIARRCASVNRQIDGLSQTLDFGDEGEIQLKEWQPDPYFGKPILESVDHDGRQAFRLSTREGPSIGRWRKTVWLKAGHYELRGQVKLTDVHASPGDPRGGIALWTSAERIRERVTGDQTWSSRPVQFSVRRPIQEIELYCEYRAAGGTAWVDADSLRIRRLSEKSP